VDNQNNYIADSLYDAFDNASAARLGALLEGVDMSDLHCPAQGRIMRRTAQKLAERSDGNVRTYDTNGGRKMQPRLVRRITAAAAAVLVLISAFSVISNEKVYAAISRYFSFVPGVGVVDVTESTSDSDVTLPRLIWNHRGASAEDSMLRLTVRSVVVNEDCLELVYTTEKIKLTGAVLDEALQRQDTEGRVVVAEACRELGYEKYFNILDEELTDSYDFFQPLSTVSVGGAQLERISQIPSTTEIFNELAVVERYRIDTSAAEDMTGTLSVGGVTVKIDLDAVGVSSDPSEVVSGGEVCSAGGVTVLCMPVWTEDRLYTDLYVLDCGIFDRPLSFSNGETGFPEIIVNGTVIGGETESWIGGMEGGSYIGSASYDLTEAYGSYESVPLYVPGIAFGTDEETVIDLPQGVSGKTRIDMNVPLTKGELELHSINCLTGDERMLHSSEQELQLWFTCHESEDILLNWFGEIAVNGVPVDEWCTYEAGSGEITYITLPLHCPAEEVHSVTLSGFQYINSAGFNFTLAAEGSDAPEESEEQSIQNAEWSNIPVIGQYFSPFEYGKFLQSGYDEQTGEAWVLYTDVVITDAEDYCRSIEGKRWYNGYTDNRLVMCGETVCGSNGDTKVEWNMSYVSGEMLFRAKPLQ